MGRIYLQPHFYIFTIREWQFLFLLEKDDIMEFNIEQQFAKIIIIIDIRLIHIQGTGRSELGQGDPYASQCKYVLI